MLHRSIGTACLASAIAIATAGSLWAAVPLDRVEGWRQSAPDVANVTTLSIDRRSETRPSGNGGSTSTTYIALTVRVDVVQRTVSGLQPGAVIVVRYSTSFHTPPLPGIQQDFVPNAGDKVVAYLKQTNDKSYILACAFGCLAKS